MSIQIDTTDAINSPGASGSKSITIGSNSNRALVVYGRDVLTGAKFNGVSPDFVLANLGNAYLVFLNPATGTHNFTWTGGGSGGYQSIISLYNVTYAGVFNFGNASGSSNTSSVSGNTHSNSIVLTTVTFASSGVNPAPQNGQTALNAVTGNASAYKIFNGSQSPTLTYTNGGTSAAWTTYGIELVEVLVPTVTTQAESSVSYTTAVGNGTITDLGDAANNTERGVVYDTASHADPGNVAPASSAYPNAVTESGSFGTGAFTENMTGLAPGTTYYVRAYSKNSVGYAYGNEISFTTVSISVPTVTTQAVSSITGTTATENGTVTDDGGAVNDVQGFVYDTASHSLPGNVAPGSSGYASSQSQSGSFGVGAYSLGVTGLTPGTTYYVRAYSHNSAGYSYGNEVSFATLSILPTVTTQAATSIENNNAYANGNITNTGGENEDIRGFVYDTVSHSLPGNVAPGSSGYASAKSESGSFGTGAYSLLVTGLIPVTIYYMRAYVHNSIGYSYGGEVSFLTEPTPIPPAGPDLTFRSYLSPFNALSSPLTYIQSKVGSSALPVLHGEVSNPVLFRLYNNFALNSGIKTAMNVALTTYDGLGIGSHTANTLPVSQSWLHLMEHGFGQNSTITPDLYTRYDGMDTPVGGNNLYYAEKGSDGSYGVPDIWAGNNAKGAGYIEYKSYCSVPDDTPGDDYNFIISALYEYTS